MLSTSTLTTAAGGNINRLKNLQVQSQQVSLAENPLQSHQSLENESEQLTVRHGGLSSLQQHQQHALTSSVGVVHDPLAILETTSNNNWPQNPATRQNTMETT